MFHFRLKHVAGKTFGIQPGDPIYEDTEAELDNNPPPLEHEDSEDWPPILEFEDFMNKIDPRGGYLLMLGQEAKASQLGLAVSKAS